MSNEKALKQQNSSYIRGFIVANILAFWFTTGFKFSSLIEGLELSFGKVSEEILEATISSILLYILTIVIAGLLSSEVKYILVFWRFKDVLPGCRAFSYYMLKDPRVNPKVLEASIGKIPSEPIEQNRLWYKLYKKYEHEKSVLEAQKNFLLTRELSSISFLFLFGLGTAGYFLFESYAIWTVYVIGLFSIFLLTALAAKNYGVRFVTNVLAVETIAEKAEAKNEP